MTSLLVASIHVSVGQGCYRAIMMTVYERDRELRDRHTRLTERRHGRYRRRTHGAEAGRQCSDVRIIQPFATPVAADLSVEQVLALLTKIVRVIRDRGLRMYVSSSKASARSHFGPCRVGARGGCCDTKVGIDCHAIRSVRARLDLRFRAYLLAVPDLASPRGIMP